MSRSDIWSVSTWCPDRCYRSLTWIAAGATIACLLFPLVRMRKFYSKVRAKLKCICVVSWTAWRCHDMGFVHRCAYTFHLDSLFTPSRYNPNRIPFGFTPMLKLTPLTSLSASYRWSWHGNFRMKTRVALHGCFEQLYSIIGGVFMFLYGSFIYFRYKEWWALLEVIP